METSANDWSFECQPAGRDGFFFYHEGSREIPFYWEYGGSDVLVIVRILEPDKFDLRYPWAATRRREIFERVAQELIRGRPTCRTEIDDESFCIYVKEKVAASYEGSSGKD